MSVTAFWFRRDLRLLNNHALAEAFAASYTKTVSPIYLIDQSQLDSLSPIRAHSLLASLESLRASIGDGLTVRVVKDSDDYVRELVRIVQTLGVEELFATRMFDPHGIEQQNAVGLALREVGVFLRLVGSNYAVAPGTVTKPDGTPYRVYTPFYKAWLTQLKLEQVDIPKGASWHGAEPSDELPKIAQPAPFKIRAGEQYAAETFAKFKRRALHEYDENRNRADLSGTSHLSHALAHGEIHPNTLLAQLADSQGEIVFAKELCWREFYADVLFHNLHSLTDYYEPRFAKMRYDVGATAEARLQAWKEGKTGYPMVDAGMRQLAQTGWMHNRVRMIVASFLVKDLHLEWQQGAEHFEALLTDFDPASNAHGWQWTAGCGTDASPYYRVFNPVMQGYKFDPNGDYVRRYIPELRHIDGADVHEPWNLIHGYLHGYPERIVDHATEREESLARLEEIKVRD